MKVAQRDLFEALEKMYREGKGTDITLVCQGTRKPVHSAVLIARSPFFEAKVERWGNEKGEVVIEACDPEVLSIVVDYMYGADLPSMDCPRFGKILEISEMFLMADLKAELENTAIKMINKANVKELGGKADKYGCKSLLNSCAQFMVKEGVCLDGVEVKKMPDATAACMEAFKSELEKKKNMEVVLRGVEDEKRSLEVKLMKVEDEKRSLEVSLRRMEVKQNELETRVKIVKEKLAVKKREKCGFCGYKKN